MTSIPPNVSVIGPRVDFSLTLASNISTFRIKQVALADNLCLLRLLISLKTDRLTWGFAACARTSDMRRFCSAWRRAASRDRVTTRWSSLS